jgi:hypothetical protein
MVAVFSVHLQHLKGVARGHVRGLEGDPQARVATRGRACQHQKVGQYVRASNEKDGNKLKDQLTNCPDRTLRSALYKALGDRIDTISVTDLMKEIEVLA